MGVVISDVRLGSIREACAANRAEELKLLCALRAALVAYGNGAETAREVDEQLAALVVHMESIGSAQAHERDAAALRAQRHGAAEARQVMQDWLRTRAVAPLNDYVRRRGGMELQYAEPGQQLSALEKEAVLGKVS